MDIKNISTSFFKKKNVLFGLLIFSIIIIFKFDFFFNAKNNEFFYNFFLNKKNLNQNVKIVMWTKVFRNKIEFINEWCPYYNRCIYTYDKYISDADAYIYHHADIDKFSVFNKNKYYIFLTQESFFNTIFPKTLPSKCIKFY